MDYLLSFIFIFSTYVVKIKSETAYAVTLNESALLDGAVCIDGSVPFYYIASGTNRNKWLVSFKGGGWCGGDTIPYGHGSGGDWPESCYTRSFNSKGGSNSYTPTMEFSGNEFSSSESENPLMYDWNKVLIMYCDGASFSGNRDLPDIVTINGTTRKLYSRGHRIIIAAYNDLLYNKNMINATDIIIHGGSAGALAVWLHIDWIYQNLLKNVISNDCRVSGLPDSGFFIESNGYNGISNYSNTLKWVFNNGNASYGSINTKCIEYYGGFDSDLAYKCMFAQNVAPFINIPFFALNSEYDSWQTKNILGSSNDLLINKYGSNFTNILKEKFLNYNNISNNNNRGAFIDSCHHHCGNFDSMIIDNYTQATAHQLFYNSKVINNDNNIYTWFQNKSYPCQSCCGSGAKTVIFD